MSFFSHFINIWRINYTKREVYNFDDPLRPTSNLRPRQDERKNALAYDA